MQFLQLWIMPAQRGLEPAVEQRQYTAADRHNRLLRIVKPEGAEGEGVSVAQDASVYVARLDPDVTVEHVFGPGRGGYFYLIRGAAELNGERLTTGDAAKILGAGQLRVQASEVSELMLVDTPL
jgi:redox-sensitive bicupin YhaK (pirin superfamily)